MPNWSIDPDLDAFDLDSDDFHPSIPLKKVPAGDVFEASRAGDVERLRCLIDAGVNVNARDHWDSVALYYACLAGHVEAARMLLEAGAICSEHTFDGDRCHYAALNLRVRRLLKAFEARPPPLGPLPAALRHTFLSCPANRLAYIEQCNDPIAAGLEVAVDDMEDLARTCKVCKCEELQKILQKESIHQKYADYKSLKDVDNSQKRFILQGSSLPEGDRLPSTLRQILQTSLSKSLCRHTDDDHDDDGYEMHMGQYDDDLADVCIKVEKRIFRCHQVILASRSEYFKARLTHVTDFLESNGVHSSSSLVFLEEHELSVEVFEKMIEYMYTDSLKDVDPDQAEEIFDAASRYLLFSLKRAAAEALLPRLEISSPAELCHWLILSDMYSVTKIREYCLDTIACNFEIFAETWEFRAMLLTVPPPSGDSSLRTTHPSAPGSMGYSNQGNLLDDLREKWLEAEGEDLDKRDESAMQFDKRLEMLMLMAEHEAREVCGDFPESATHSLKLDS